jgi:hypothetical protein
MSEQAASTIAAEAYSAASTAVWLNRSPVPALGTSHIKRKRGQRPKCDARKRRGHHRDAPIGKESSCCQSRDAKCHEADECRHPNMKDRHNLCSHRVSSKNVHDRARKPTLFRHSLQVRGEISWSAQMH